MTMLKILAIIAIGVLAWWIPGCALDEANSLEQEGTGGVPGRIIPDPVPKPFKAPSDPPCQKREVNDFRPRRVELVPNPDGDHLPKILSPIDPVQKEQLRQAGIYRRVRNATKDWWWYVPLALTVLLIVSKTTSLFQRRAEIEPVEKAVEDGEIEASHKREMEKLDKLIELERLKQPPESTQPESRAQ